MRVIVTCMSSGSLCWNATTGDRKCLPDHDPHLPSQSAGVAADTDGQPFRWRSRWSVEPAGHPRPTMQVCVCMRRMKVIGRGSTGHKVVGHPRRPRVKVARNACWSTRANNRLQCSKTRPPTQPKPPLSTFKSVLHVSASLESIRSAGLSRPGCSPTTHIITWSSRCR